MATALLEAPVVFRPLYSGQGPYWQCFRGPFCTSGPTRWALTAEELEQENVGDRHPTAPCPECGKPLCLVGVVKPDTRPCWFCQKAIRSIDKSKTVSVIPDRRDPTRYELRWAHALCATEAGGEKTSSLATYKTTSGMPDCRACGLSYEMHFRHVTTIWDAYCDTESLPDVQQWYRPAEPFRSRNWPYRLITDSPRYTTDGKIGYAETEDEAIERLKAMANA